jgi:ElaB/YqjD/DUF883 family membrane-anchored ribosome-binding protein
MGKKPDQIEHDIEAKRAQIGQRIENLQHRAHNDVETMRTEAKDRSSMAFEDAKDSLKVDSVKQMMEDHTLSTMAGALGVGVLLGVVSEGFGSGGSSSSRDGYRSRDGHREGGGMTGMLASLIGPAASTAQNELQDLVREGFDTLKGQVRQVGHEDKRVENRDVGVE